MNSTDSRKGKGLIRRQPVNIFGTPTTTEELMNAMFEEMVLQGKAVMRMNNYDERTLVSHEEMFKDYH